MRRPLLIFKSCHSPPLLVGAELPNQRAGNLTEIYRHGLQRGKTRETSGTRCTNIEGKRQIRLLSLKRTIQRSSPFLRAQLLLLNDRSAQVPCSFLRSQCREPAPSQLRRAAAVSLAKHCYSSPHSVCGVNVVRSFCNIPEMPPEPPPGVAGLLGSPSRFAICALKVLGIARQIARG